MILIFSGIGATRMYPDVNMMRKTLTGFLNSLANQTDKNFRLFLSYHDDPGIPKERYPFIQWCPISPDGGTKTTKVPEALPRSVLEPINYKTVLYDCGEDDLSRKVVNSVIEAFLWARDNALKEFWLMRMDSDDLLARDTVENVHKLDGQGFRTMFNRICHMYDPKKREMAIHKYISSTTCHAMKFRIGDGGIPNPNWFYMCHDHSDFKNRVQREKIPVKELDFIYCICTNTGNNLSGRPEIDKERFCTKILMTKPIIERYGLDSFTEK